MGASFSVVLDALRAAGEPTRLRLLELLTHGELTVGEISTILEQSQPRISRHLKMLCDAGLLDRFREEHWVYYRVALTGVGAQIAKQIFEWVGRDDALVQGDQRRLAKVLAARVKNVVAATEARESVSELRDFLVREWGAETIGDLLDIGTGTGLVLQALGGKAARAVGVDISTEALRIARTQTHSAGLSHCLFRRADMYGLPFEDGSFDTVTMDRVLAAAEEPALAVVEAARTLRPGGRFCVVEDFDVLADRSTVSPLSEIRGWLEAAGLDCERIHPIDFVTDAGPLHLMIITARANKLARKAA